MGPPALTETVGREAPAGGAPSTLGGMGGAEAKVQTWFAFLRAHRVASRALESDLAMTDVTPTAFEVLFRLDRAAGAGLNAADLATALRMTRRGLAPVCDRLVRQGYVDRRRDVKDRRVSRFSITGTGKQALERATPIHLAGVHMHFLDGLTQKEARELRSSMGKVLALNDASRRR
jgi:DNA-binding MarR family transcriptional regulator